MSPSQKVAVTAKIAMLGWRRMCLMKMAKFQFDGKDTERHSLEAHAGV